MMKDRSLAAALVLSFLAATAGAESQRAKYVPCPKGMEGQCGDIPGAASSAVGSGEIICEEGRFRARKDHAANWAARTHQVATGLNQIDGAIIALGGQFAAQGKKPPLLQLSGFIRADLLARLVNPTIVDLDRAAPCYARNQAKSDGCHYLACGDPDVIMRNLEGMGPAISRIDADLERKRANLKAGLPTEIMVGTGLNRRNRCEDSSPQPPCQQLMESSINQLIQASQALARTVGQLTGQ